MQEIKEVLPAARGRAALRVAVEGVQLSASAARLYGVLLAAPSTRQASNETLAGLLGCADKTIVRGLAELETAGLVERHYSKLARRLELTSGGEMPLVAEAL